MGYGLTVRIRGPRACFTRPDLKVERVSYDAITPSTIRGLMKSVYWKPAIEWHVDEITVLNEIKYANVMRNEVTQKISAQQVRGALRRGEPVGLAAAQERTQRHMAYLRDVDYLARVRFTVERGGEGPEKHYNIALRRLRAGQCFHQPYLGQREFAADVSLVEEGSEAPRSFYADVEDIYLGTMLRYLEFDGEAGTVTPTFFAAHMRRGVIEVPPAGRGRGTRA